MSALQQLDSLIAELELQTSAGTAVEKKADKKDKKKESAAPAAEAAPTEDILDPSQLDIRVGHVVKCWNHPDSDKLLCEEIDLGEAVVRTIASGIRPHYQAEDLQGRKVCVLANLKDRNLAGFKSQGMVLCAVSADHTAIKLVDPPVNATAGERITFPGFTGEPASSSAMAKKKILEKLAPQLKTDDKGVAHWGPCAFTIRRQEYFIATSPHRGKVLFKLLNDMLLLVGLPGSASVRSVRSFSSHRQ